MNASDRKGQNSIIQTLASLLLKIIGWQIVGNFPELPKYVLVGAPHTSNWDFPVAMLWMFASGVRFAWIGKHTLFESPLGPMYYRLGGIPVRRDRSHNFVDQIVEQFECSDELIIAITPEGTRGKLSYWKTGFYHMAVGAGVPIVMGFLDFEHKHIGIGPILYPSGDIHADFSVLREFYSGIKGRHPHKQGAIELRPSDTD
jgi:1-acyl-sn-glycerol-3-phosphate acyltransferase